MEWLIYVHGILFGAFLFFYVWAWIDIIKFRRSKKK